MSHAATQIRDWFKAACTGVSGLPTCTEGTPRQIQSNTKNPAKRRRKRTTP